MKELRNNKKSTNNSKNNSTSNTTNNTTNNSTNNTRLARRARRRRLAMLIIIMLVLVAASCMWLLHRGKTLNNDRAQAAGNEVAALNAEVTAKLSEAGGMARTLVAAQHVYSGTGKEDTAAQSFTDYDEALAAGSIYIEQDLVISSDGVLYVSQDLNAYQATGINRLYSSMTADEIDKLETTAGGRILRASDVFDRYGRKVRYVTGLKAFEDTRIVDAFRELVDKYGFEDIVTVQCEDLHTLSALKNVYPDMPRLYRCKSQWGFDTSLEKDYVDIICVQDWLMTEERCQLAHDKGKIFSAWTLDSEEQIRRAIDMGVDTYFTGDAALAISLEKDYGISTRK